MNILGFTALTQNHRYVCACMCPPLCCCYQKGKSISGRIMVTSGGSSTECHLHRIPSGLQEQPSTCWPALICCQRDINAGQDYKEKKKPRQREASPVNQKCPVQVGPVLTCCHMEPNVRGEGGSGHLVCVCVCTCLCSVNILTLICKWVSNKQLWTSPKSHIQHNADIKQWYIHLMRHFF